MNKEDRDPIACSLFYLTLNKKNVLLGLWKLATTHPEQPMMVKFLANNFQEERWQKAALKNAFVLLGKQRFEYACAFFLLGNSPKDAINVCIKNLQDYQLAIVIARVYEGDDSQLLRSVLKDSIIPEARSSGDRFLLSMCFSILKDKSMALECLLEVNDQKNQMENWDPAYLVLYRALSSQYQKIRYPITVSVEQEYEFMIHTVGVYEKLGCPGLALFILESTKMDLNHFVKEEKQSDTKTNVAEVLDWGEPISKPIEVTYEATKQNNTFDWSEPISKSVVEDYDTFKKENAFDWGSPISKPIEDDYDAFRKTLITDSTFNEIEEPTISEEETKIEKACEETIALANPKIRKLQSYVRLYKGQLALKLLQVYLYLTYRLGRL
jgi:hypothetical protein